MVADHGGAKGIRGLLFAGCANVRKIHDYLVAPIMMQSLVVAAVTLSPGVASIAPAEDGYDKAIADPSLPRLALLAREWQ